MRDSATWGEEAKALARSGRYGEAEALLRHGLNTHPSHPVLSYALGILLLARGAYEEGWPLYEHRHVMPGGSRPPRFDFPRWDGRPVDTLLVLPEQGIGDQIMFARYVPKLAEQGIRVTLVTTAPTARLFSRLGASILIVDGRVSVPRHDAWVRIGSLPGLIPMIPTEPYLDASASPAGGLGVMLRGSGRFIERESPRNVVEALGALGRSLHPDQTGAHDFQDTAEIIAGLDQVISIDTSVAHLAGALGKPTYVLLPYEADWRWGRDGLRSVWYPSIRLFRQTRSGDWSEAATAILSEFNLNLVSELR